MDPSQRDRNGQAARCDSHATKGTADNALADVDPRGHTISGLYAAYIRLHDPLPFEEFRAKVRKGVALWDDLELGPAERALPHLRKIRATVARQSPICTTALQQLLDELLSLTLQDGLTGLFNRRYFDHRLHQELQRARREHTHCSVIMADIDNFKQVNDTYGHDVGDRLLQHVSNVVKSCLRASDEVTARVGGEEFAIILPNTSAEHAPIIAERLRTRVRHAPISEQLSPALQLSISIGVSTASPSIVLEPADLVKRADVALYRAKHAGKNAVSTFDADHPEETQDAKRRKDGH